MQTVRMDAAVARTLAERVIEGADRLCEIRWPSLDPADLPGSATVVACAPELAEGHLADVVAGMRTWAAAVCASVAAIERAEFGHAGLLGEPR